MKKHLSAVAWLAPKQLREVTRRSWVMVSISIFVSLFVSTLLLAAAVHLEGALEKEGIKPASRMSAMPASRLVRSALQWDEVREVEEKEGPLQDIRIWLDCANASPEQCQQGSSLLEAVGAIRVGKDEQAHLDVRWEGEGWEVGSRVDGKYILPAAVVLHFQATRESWQYVFRPRFMPAQENANEPKEHMEGFLSTIALQILILGLLVPSVIIASFVSGISLSAMTEEVEDGKYEVLASAVMPPWVLLFSKALAPGLGVGFLIFGLTLLMGLVVGPIPLVVSLSFAASMALITVSTCLWGFLLMTVHIFLGRFRPFKFLRALPNPAVAVPALFVYLMVFTGSVSVSVLSTSALANHADKDQVLPLVDWGMLESSTMVSGCLIYFLFSLMVFLLIHQSPWGKRRLSIRAKNQ